MCQSYARFVTQNCVTDIFLALHCMAYIQRKTVPETVKKTSTYNMLGFET